MVKQATAPTGQWQFWIDRGGTFTDIVAQRPDGSLVVHKLLSENPEQYADAAIAGIRSLLSCPDPLPLPRNTIGGIKMGTTVATNALLERQGATTVLVINTGFGDALRIAYQHRPQIFAQQIQLPEMLYAQVIEVKVRVDAQGRVLQPLKPLASSPARSCSCMAIGFLNKNSNSPRSPKPSALLKSRCPIRSVPGSSW
jgi:5-oxoprolinase (ATP-hydrolysing)